MPTARPRNAGKRPHRQSPRAGNTVHAAALHPDDQPVADLWLRYARRRKDLGLRNQLVEHYYQRAAKIASRLGARLPPGRRDDVRSRCSEVLIRCVERFAPAAGVAFLCFLRRRLRGAVLDVYREGDPRKRKVFDRLQARVRATKSLVAALGRPPTDEEIAARLGCTVAQLWRDREGEELSLHAKLPSAKDGRAFTLLDILEAPAAGDIPPEDPAETERLFLAATAELRFLERLVLWLRCCRRKKPHNIARILNLPPKRVAALEKRAIARLRRTARRPKASDR